MVNDSISLFRNALFPQTVVAAYVSYYSKEIWKNVKNFRNSNADGWAKQSNQKNDIDVSSCIAMAMWHAH